MMHMKAFKIELAWATYEWLWLISNDYYNIMLLKQLYQ